MREMKDSGVEWIGKIPKDWEIVPLTKQLDSIVDYRGKTPEKTEEGTFLVTAKNIKDGKICYELSKEYVREADYEEIMHRGIPQIGDILFTTEAPLGQVANVDRTDIALAQRIIKFRALSTVNNYYLKYWMLNEGFQQFLHSLSTGSTATGIKSSKLFLLPLVKQIQKSTKGSLLEYVLKNHIDLNEYDDFASLTAELSEKVSEKLAYMMKLACDFNNLVYMARVRYNVMLSEDENTYANDEWSRLLPDIRHNATVDLDAVFGELQLINPRAKSFLSGIQTAFMASDIDMADELIRKRERSLKGAARAKLSRTKEFDHSKWVGGGMLDYRFSNARRIVNDIYAGEVNADV